MAEFKISAEELRGLRRELFRPHRVAEWVSKGELEFAMIKCGIIDDSSDFNEAVAYLTQAFPRREVDNSDLPLERNGGFAIESRAGGARYQLWQSDTDFYPERIITIFYQDNGKSALDHLI